MTTPEPEAPEPPKKVISLRGVAPPIPTVDAEVIETLESILATARDGQVVGVAIATVSFNHDTGASWAGSSSSVMLIGATARLLHHLNVMEDGNQDDEC